MRWPWGTVEYELLGQFFVYFVPGFEEDIFDSAIAVDVQIVEFRRTGRLEALTALIDELSATTTTDEEVIDELRNSIGMSGLPEGTGYRAWLLALQARLHEVRANPDAVPATPLPPTVWRANRRRASWFPDPDLQDLVADAVLDAHEEAGRHWTEDPTASGWKRQHYYADLDDLRERIGDFGLTAPYTVIDRTTMPDPDRTEPATGAVVVLNLGYHTGQITGLAAYPERHLDQSLRTAYPDLCHWFGGFFYQGETTPVLAMDAACRSTQDPARSRVRDQLTMLLHEDDHTMYRIVEACGSYLLPDGLRHWIDRTLWRLDAYPWLGPNGETLRE